MGASVRRPFRRRWHEAETCGWGASHVEIWVEKPQRQRVYGGKCLCIETQAGVTGGGRGNRGFPGLLPVLCFSSSLKYLENSI